MSQRFESTVWPVIANTQGTDSIAVREGLQTICTLYWLPLYSHVRRRGYAPPEAEDLTQAFFEHLLTCDLLRQVHPGRGRFRTYLLACLDHFLSNEWDRKNALKRGGGVPPIPLDFVLAEGELARQDLAEADPEIAFDRQWAETLLDTAIRRLEGEYRAAGKLALFQALQKFLGRHDGVADHGAATPELGLSAGALRVAIHRMRRRYAALAREEIARTVEGDDAVRAELNYLIKVMSR